MRFSQWWLWQVTPSGMWSCVIWYKFTNVLEKHTASIFRAQEQAKHAAACLAYLYSTERLVILYQTIWCHIPEDSKYSSVYLLVLWLLDSDSVDSSSTVKLQQTPVQMRKLKKCETTWITTEVFLHNIRSSCYVSSMFLR
jgi:hypothetical protein